MRSRHRQIEPGLWSWRGGGAMFSYPLCSSCCSTCPENHFLLDDTDSQGEDDTSVSFLAGKPRITLALFFSSICTRFPSTLKFSTWHHMNIIWFCMCENSWPDSWNTRSRPPHTRHTTESKAWLMGTGSHAVQAASRTCSGSDMSEQNQFSVCHTHRNNSSCSACSSICSQVVWSTWHCRMGTICWCYMWKKMWGIRLAVVWKLNYLLKIDNSVMPIGKTS